MTHNCRIHVVLDEVLTLSPALMKWNHVQLKRLREIEHAHKAVGGGGPGRRVATQQINDAFFVLLAGLWQEYCRNLHSEAALVVVQAVPASLQAAIREGLILGRNIDRGNATPVNVERDFRRFDLELWSDVYARDPRNRARKRRLDQLYVWRNAIAHQDLPLTGGRAQQVAGTRRTLQWARRFEAVCSELAAQLDRVVGDHLGKLTGNPPW